MRLEQGQTQMTLSISWDTLRVRWKFRWDHNGINSDGAQKRVRGWKMECTWTMDKAQDGKIPCVTEVF